MSLDCLRKLILYSHSTAKPRRLKGRRSKALRFFMRNVHLVREHKKRPQATKLMRPFNLFGWCHQESNRGHKDFQSFALPTELWHLVLGSAKVALFLFIAKKYWPIIISLQQIRKPIYGNNSRF